MRPELKLAADTTGVPGLQTVILWLLIAALVGIYGYVIWDIWTAHTHKPPHLSSTLTVTAGALAASIGTGFALALGIRKKEEIRDGHNRTLGSPGNHTLLPAKGNGTSWPLVVGVYAYLVIGIACFATYLIHADETPATVRAIAVAMAAYVATVGSNAFGSIQTLP